MIWARVDSRGKFNYTTIQAVNKAVGFCQLQQLSSLLLYDFYSRNLALHCGKWKSGKSGVFYSLFKKLHMTKGQIVEIWDFVYLFGVHVQE